jgi:hypothetical protein
MAKVFARRANCKRTSESNNQPDKWFRKAAEQSIPTAFVKNVAGEMQQAIDASADADHASVPIQHIDDTRMGKQNAERRKRQPRAERPDRYLASLMQKLLYGFAPSAPVSAGTTSSQTPTTTITESAKSLWATILTSRFIRRDLIGQKFLPKSTPA